MKKVEESFKKIIMTKMIFSVVFGILGLIIFLKSEMTNNVVGILLGIFFFVSGVIEIYSSIERNRIRLFHFDLFLGIISIIIGIFTMLNPLTILNILNIGLGVWILAEGINNFVLFINLKKADEESYKIFFVSALLNIFMGIIIIANPFRNIVITKTIGIFIMLYSVLNLDNLVLLKKKATKFLKSFE